MYSGLTSISESHIESWKLHLLLYLLLTQLLRISYRELKDVTSSPSVDAIVRISYRELKEDKKVYQILKEIQANLI